MLLRQQWVVGGQPARLRGCPEAALGNSGRRRNAHACQDGGDRLHSPDPPVARFSVCLAPPLARGAAPLMTAVGAVDRIITDLAVLDVTPHGLKVVEMAPGVTRDELQSKTGVALQ